MGMYTELRCKVKVKSEWIHVADQLCNDEKVIRWEDVRTENIFIKKIIDVFSQAERSSDIPFGNSQFKYFDKSDNNWQHTFKDDIWTFQCSLKNYGNEISKFLKYVLPNMIIESYYIEEIYEESDASTMYEFKDGAIVSLSPENGISYGYDDSGSEAPF